MNLHKNTFYIIAAIVALFQHKAVIEETQWSDLSRAQDLLYRYVSQLDIPAYARAGDGEKVSHGSERFLANNIVCAVFYSNGKFSSSSRSCAQFIEYLDKWSELDHGWSIFNDYFLLTLKRDDLTSIAIVENPYKMSLVNDRPFISKFSSDFFLENYKSIIIKIIAAWLIFVVILNFVKGKIESERKSRHLHDHRHANQNISYIAKGIYSALNPIKVKELSRKLVQSCILKDATLNTSSPAFNQLDLIQAIEDFLDGFFIERSLSWLDYQKPNANIYVLTDKNHLFRVFINLFDNAYKEVSKLMFYTGNIKFSLKITDMPNTTKITLLNSITFQSYLRIILINRFPFLFKNRGLKNIKNELGKLETEITIKCKPSFVEFSFELPKKLES